MFIFVISYKNIHNMKKLFYLLFYLIPFVSFAQVSTGMEMEADYGFRNLSPQTVTNPDYLGTLGNDGTMGQIGSTDFLRGRVAQSDTGVLEFLGLSTNSATTINIGAVVGYVVNNETNPEDPTFTRVSYSGASNVSVTTVGTGVASYVMLSSAGVISFQNTFPTSAERKAKIWLGKVSHPLGAITLVVNEPDYITSPLAFSRDWAQDLGPYVNNGVYPYANGANLNINITGGTITGDGINFVTSKTDPNHLTMGAAVVASFTYRTQTGVGGATTAVTPAVYDLAGTVTAIPGSTNQATIQYFYVLPGIGYVAQLGQTIYPTFSAAVAALGKETFVRYPSFVGNVLPVAALIVTKGCTALNDTGVTAQFFNANKNGDFFGASAGVSTATLQSAYTNSVQPTITTNSTLGSLTVKRGSAADTDNVLTTQGGSGVITSRITGEGGGSVASRPGVMFGIGNDSPTAKVHLRDDFELYYAMKIYSDKGTDHEYGLKTGGLNAERLSLIDITSSNKKIFDLGADIQLGPDGTLNTLIGTTVNNGSDMLQVNGSALVDKFKYTRSLDITGQDLNTITSAGFYSGQTLTNAPTSGYFYITVERLTSDSNWVHQTATSLGSGNNGNIIYSRTRQTGAWGAWKRITYSDDPVLITITTTVSITTATLDSDSLGQNGKHVVISNGVNPINLTCNGSVTASYGKVGTGAITFVQGSGRTLVQLSGTAVLNGAVGSTATLWSNGTTDYLAITNY